MKKVFIPKMEDLEKMETMGANIESYLATKVVEILVLEGMKYPSKNSFNGESEDIRENPTIAHSVCLINPESISHSNVARYDSDLCLKLLDKKNGEKTSNLNKLNYFSDSVITNQLVIKKVIEVLFQEIKRNPNLRFTYTNNTLLDNVFAGTFEYYLKCLGLDESHMYHFIYMLAAIEPYYALLLDKDNHVTSNSKKLLGDALNDYLGRYDIQMYDDYSYHGVINEQNVNTKKYLQRIRQYKEDNKTIMRK